MKRWDKKSQVYRFISIGAGLVLIGLIVMLGVIGCDNNEPTGTTNEPPPVPSNPVPADQAVNQDIGVRLEWICQDPDEDNLVYYVYFGTNNPPPLVDTAYTYLYSHDRLNFNATYYWKVVADDGYGHQVESPTWSFTTGNFYLLDDYDTQDAYRVKIFNDLIYVVEDNQGLRIFDVTDTSEAVGIRVDSVGMYTTGGPNYDVYVDNNVAYLATLDGVTGINVTVPSDPQFLFTTGRDEVGDDEDGRSVEASGDTVFLITSNSTDSTSYLKILDISNLDTLSIIGQTQFDGIAIDMVIQNFTAFVADSLNGIRAFDISDPANPTLNSTLMTYGNPIAIYIDGVIAYIADGAAGLTTVNVSSPSSMEILGNIDTPGYARDVYVYQSRAFVADYWNGGIQIADVSNPDLPDIIDSRESRGGAFGIYAGPKTLLGQDITAIYFADAFAGLLVFEYNLQ